MTARKLAAAALLSSIPAAGYCQPVNGLYVGAGVGVGFLQDGGINNIQFPKYGQSVGGLSGRSGDGHTQAGIVTSASLGYGFGNGLRLELQGDWRQSQINIASGLYSGGKEQQFGGFVNALYDFNLTFGLPGLTPYLGAGLGYEQVQLQNVRAFGAVSGPPIFLRGTGTDGGFAVQGIAGLSYPVSIVPGLALTAEYRFTTIPGDLTYKGQGYAPRTSGRVTFGTNENYNHALIFGVRYAFGAPAAPAIASVSAPVPAPAPARTYLVFFDWDRADLTDRARQVVSEAAQASARVQSTQIRVNGYTDASGSAHYNHDLSIRRAQSVAAELIQDGVPRTAINISGFGQTHPLVPTADGAREPQNRRVEIIL